MIEINLAQNGGSVDIALGESFEIRLPENPTTGYRWQLQPSELTNFDLEEDTFERSRGAYGAGGVRHWRFRARKAGVTHLDMEYRRSWESQVTETFRITIRVQPQ
jgi:inhibitor of cysteine peptidase